MTGARPAPTSQPRDTLVGVCVAPPLPDDPRVIAVERHRDRWVYVVEDGEAVAFVEVSEYQRGTSE